MEFNRKNVRILLGIIAFAVLLFVGLWHLDAVLGVLGFLLGVMTFFIIGLCVAFILNTPMMRIETKLFAPLNRRLGKRWLRIRRPLAVFITLLLVLALLFFAVFLVIPEIGRTFAVLADEIPGFLADANVWLNSLTQEQGGWIEAIRLTEIDWNELAQSAVDLLRNGAGNFLTGTVSAASSIVSSVVSFVVGVILAVYILASKERLGGQVRRVLYAYLPERRVDRVLQVGHMASKTFASFITGQVLEAMILGVLCFIGMSIFGFRFAPAVSLLVGVTAFIPIFGAFIGWFIGAFMILVNQGWMTAVWFSLFFIVLQQIEGNLIYPHVVGKSVMLPGLWVLVAVTIGGNLAGILGMLISVPLASLLYALLREAVDRRNAARGIGPEKLKGEAE